MPAHPFPPVYSAHSRVLILGSFPSVRSRQEGFYYGHPRNRFWPMLAAIFGVPEPTDIAGKSALLLENGLALWDVLAGCEITGSSDASIRGAVPNDLTRILDVCPIVRVVCNGSTAGRLYRKHMRFPKLPMFTLPSTSPANAVWNLPRLIEVWREALII